VLGTVKTKLITVFSLGEEEEEELYVLGTVKSRSTIICPGALCAGCEVEAKCRVILYVVQLQTRLLLCLFDSS